MTQPTYILKKIIAAYRNVLNDKLLFIEYCILEDQAWHEYRNYDERTTNVNYYYDSHYNKLTIITNKSATSDGVCYSQLCLHVLSDNLNEFFFQPFEYLSRSNKHNDYQVKSGSIYITSTTINNYDIRL